MLQEKDTSRVGTRIRGCDGNRILLRRGNGVRFADLVKNRRGPPAHDPGLGAQPSHRFLRHANFGKLERQVQIKIRKKKTVHSVTGYRGFDR